MRLLLTGFEPFGSGNANPSQTVVELLARDGVPGVALATAILPVDRRRGPAALLACYAETQPDAVLCLGQAGSAAQIAVERVAINLLDYRIPDNSGEQVVDEPVIPGGPAAYFVTLPARHVCEAIREAGVPAQLSLSAGSFLCNQVLYTLLHHLAQAGPAVPAGFLHLPNLPEQAATAAGAPPSMAAQTMALGVRAAIAAIA